MPASSKTQQTNIIATSKHLNHSYQNKHNTQANNHHNLNKQNHNKITKSTNKKKQTQQPKPNK